MCAGLGALGRGNGGHRGDMALCHTANAGYCSSQTGSGARREGSGACRSVQGCKQLDPTNEASLSRTGLIPLRSLPCLCLLQGGDA